MELTDQEELKRGERLYPKAFNEAWLDHRERYQLAISYIKPNDKVLDATSGSGYGTHFMALNTRSQSVTGVDISKHAIKWANKYFAHSKVTYIQSDLTNNLMEKLKTKYDVITSFETIEHLENPMDFLHQAKELLKDDGYLLLSTPNEEIIPLSVGKTPHHFKHYSPKDFMKTVNDAGFHIKECFTQSPDKVLKGFGGFYNIIVCSKNFSDSGFKLQPLDKAIITLNDLEIRKKYQVIRSSISDNLEIFAIDIRVKELLNCYELLLEASDLFNEYKWDKVEEILTSIDKSLCPECIFLLGLLYQAIGEYYKAVSMYSKVLSEKNRFNNNLVQNAEIQLMSVLKEIENSN